MASSLSVTAADVTAAAQVLAGHLSTTPCLVSQTLSQIAGANVALKFENLQYTASFKERGALNRLAALDADQARRGVIAMSAGNHAQGVAYHARRLGVPATIVMPRFTPHVKVEQTRHFGAEVILAGGDFDEAKAHALQLASERHLTLVHPYDDLLVIAGQGTLALEMLAAQPDLQVLLVPVGGGGLISGIAVAAKAVRPEIQIIGVQTVRFPSMYNALKGESQPYGSSTIAEGIAVKQPGELTLAVSRQLVDDVLLVEEGEIEQAMLLLLEIEKTVVEGAGAVGLAALLGNRSRFAGKQVGLVLSGGNIDPMKLSSIIERGMVKSGRLVRVTVEIPDLPGALAEVTSCLGDANANIVEVHHEREFTNLPLQLAEVDFVMQARGHEHVEQILATLASRGFTARLHGA